MPAMTEEITAAPAFTGNVGTSGTERTSRQVYEMAGSRMYQLHRSTEDAAVGAELRELLNAYEHACLFMVGLDAPSLDGVFLSELEPHEIRDFRLPFKSVVLDIPTRRTMIGVKTGITSVFFITEAEEDRYLIVEIETSDEKALVLTATLDLNRTTGERSVQQIKGWVSGLTAEEEYILRCNQNDREWCEEFKAMYVETLFRGIVRCMAYINAPMNYIVREEMPLTDRELRLKKKAVKPFFAKKDLCIVLDHSQVKALMPSIGTGRHASPVPHSRRGHWRNLRAERFKEQKRVWVRPADINAGLRWERGGRTYEVVR